MALQVASLVLAALAIVWGLAASYTVLFPGPSGEWAVGAIFLAYVINLPMGLASLILALVVKDGSNRLRRICIVAAAVAMCLPLIPDAVHRYRTRWKYHINESHRVGRVAIFIHEHLKDSG